MRWIVDHHNRAWNVIRWGAQLYEGYDMAHVHKLHKGYRNILGGAYSSALLSLVIASLLIACGGPTLPDCSAAPTRTATPPPPPGRVKTPPPAPSGLGGPADGSVRGMLVPAGANHHTAQTGYQAARR